MYDVFNFINGSINGNAQVEVFNEEFGHLVYDDLLEQHLPIPVYSYIRPDMGTKFLLHILLSLGRFITEIDLIQHELFRFVICSPRLYANRINCHCAHPG